MSEIKKKRLPLDTAGVSNDARRCELHGGINYVFLKLQSFLIDVWSLQGEKDKCGQNGDERKRDSRSKSELSRSYLERERKEEEEKKNMRLLSLTSLGSRFQDTVSLIGHLGARRGTFLFTVKLRKTIILTCSLCFLDRGLQWARETELGRQGNVKPSCTC